jgi:hypothetical protein
VEENFSEASPWCGRADLLKVDEERTFAGLLELQERFDPTRRSVLLNIGGIET